MKENKFKGGPVALNSGGNGPDDYLLKPINGGRWTLVIVRGGRHFTKKEVGLKQAQIAVRSDTEAMKKIFPIQRICVSDNARQLRKMKGNVPTMSASDFLKKYGLSV